MEIIPAGNLRTDLAREAAETVGVFPGVAQETRAENGITVTEVRVETEDAAEKLNKRVGRYVAIEQDADARDHSEAVVAAIQDTLTGMLPENCRHVLVVGLGNRFITADALGPRTAERVFVTRHIAAFVPELAPKGMRHVSALVPGVLGVTGMETMEVIRGVVQSVRPDALVCIDALAAEAAAHIGRTVQLNDNGLLPGAGVGNRQRELHAGALGLPVLAIGVPTVVSAVAIARETARLMALESGESGNAEALMALSVRAVEKRMGALIVTTKDADKLIDDAARRIAEGVNRALHGAQVGEIRALSEQ